MNSLDLSNLECTCGSPSVSKAERFFAEEWGIDGEQAHKLFDAFEDALDRSILSE